MKKVGIILLILFQYNTSKDIKAQQNVRIHEQLRFKYITIDNGLMSNRVRAIGQDKNGFIWIGANSGLSRYDGYGLTSYSQFYFGDTLQDFQESNEIICDKQGTIWVANRAGIVYYDPDEDKFREFLHPDLNERTGSIYGVDVDKSGTIWFGSSKGLYSYNPQTNVLMQYKANKNNPKNPWIDDYRRIYADTHDRIWIAYYNKGLGMFDKQSGYFTYYSNSKDENSLAQNSIERIFEDSKGYIWIGHTDEGLTRFDNKTKTFKRFYPEVNVREAGRVKGIIETNDGELMFGTQGGIYLYNPKTETFSLYANAGHPISTLSHNSVQVMIRDDKDGLWVGTYAGGVSFSNFYTSGIVWYQYNNIASKYFLNDKNVYSIFVDSDHNIWAGTENGGINFLNRNTGTYSYINMDGEPGYNTRSNNIKHIFIDDQKRVWFATYKGGFGYYDQNSKKVKNYIDFNSYPKNKDDNSVYIMFQDPVHENILWINTANNTYIFDKYKETYRLITESNDYKKPDNIGRMNDVVIKDNISHASTREGVIKIDHLEKNITALKELDGKALSSSHFLFFDKYNNLWVELENKYLLRMTHEFKDIIRIDSEDGLPDFLYQEGTSDNLGNIWLSSNNGLVKLEGIIDNPENFKVKFFGKSDNVQSKEFLYHSEAKASDGEIFFGGINGFNSFYPEKVNPNKYLPNAVITKLSIGGEKVEVNQEIYGKTILKKSIQETNKLLFNYKIKLFRFDFTGLHYVAPENNKYKYMLEGFDEDWYYSDANTRSATYSNIPRGTYYFKVDATNNNGKWSDNPAVIEIKVTPPFWKTIWFYTIMAVVLTFIIILFIKWREKQLKKDKELLEEQLRKGRDEIEKNKKEVSNQAEELRKRDLAEREQKWINTGLVKLGDVITKNKNDGKELSKIFLSELIQYIQANQGAVYILNDDIENNVVLERYAGYALPRKRMDKKIIELGEGLVGACFKDKEIKMIDQVPEGYTEISSGIGSAKLENIILMPLLFNEGAFGVIEISSLKKIEAFQVDYLTQICEMFISNIVSLKNSNNIKQLLERSQQQTEEMQAQEEEMHQNLEEMQATQEEANRREQELMRLNKEMKKKEEDFKKSLNKIKHDYSQELKHKDQIILQLKERKE